MRETRFKQQKQQQKRNTYFGSQNSSFYSQRFPPHPSPLPPERGTAAFLFSPDFGKTARKQNSRTPLSVGEGPGVRFLIHQRSISEIPEALAQPAVLFEQPEGGVQLLQNGGFVHVFFVEHI